MSFYTAKCQKNINYAAFATVTLLGAATIGSGILAATATSTAATVAYSALSVLGAAISGAAIVAYSSDKSKSVKSYFKNTVENSGYAIAGATQFVAQTMIQALVRGLAEGVATLIKRKIAGPDHTYSRV